MAIKENNVYVKAMITKKQNKNLKELVNQLGYSSVSKYINDLILKDMQNHNININE